jgi:excisionase family DNA binding protein
MTDTITIAEAAALLGIHRSSIWQAIKRGRLERVPGTGREARVARASVERYAAERRQRKPFDELSERQQYRRRAQHTQKGSTQ